jgi:hypothetical protein
MGERLRGLDEAELGCLRAHLGGARSGVGGCAGLRLRLRLRGVDRLLDALLDVVVGPGRVLLERLDLVDREAQIFVRLRLGAGGVAFRLHAVEGLLAGVAEPFDLTFVAAAFTVAAFALSAFEEAEVEARVGRGGDLREAVHPARHAAERVLAFGHGVSPCEMSWHVACLRPPPPLRRGGQRSEE